MQVFATAIKLGPENVFTTPVEDQASTGEKAFGPSFAVQCTLPQIFIGSIHQVGNGAKAS